MATVGGAMSGTDVTQEFELEFARWNGTRHALGACNGTASILDISQVSDEPDYGTAAPFSPEELKQYFGTDRPSRRDVERAEDYWEDMERGQARYAVVYSDGQPSEIYFAGYSFD